MYKCIQETVKNVERKYYGSAGHCPTGPLMMKKLFTTKQINNFELTHEFVSDTSRFINLNNYRVLKYHEQYKNEKGQQTNHWKTYWLNRTMYK